MKKPQRILIVNPFGIGDVLFTTPLIRAMRRAFPQAYMGYLCNGRTASILRTNPHIDELFVYEKDDIVQIWRTSRAQGFLLLTTLLGKIRRLGFDFVVDLSLGERYGFVLKWLGVRRRFGFDYRNRGRFLTQRLRIDGYQDMHVVKYYLRLLSFIGVKPVDDALELCVSDEDKNWASDWLKAHRLNGAGLIVGIVPAGGVSWGIDAPFRRWNAEGFAAVGDALVEKYAGRVVLFGEKSDRAICLRVAALMRNAVIDISGQTTLGQFISLLGCLNLVICNDGGPLHLAVSRKVKTVSIFGPVDPNVYGPYPLDAKSHRVVRQEQLHCSPCYHRFKLPPCPYERACLLTVEPQDVMDACEGLLAGVKR